LIEFLPASYSLYQQFPCNTLIKFDKNVKKILSVCQYKTYKIKKYQDSSLYKVEIGYNVVNNQRRFNAKVNKWA